MSRERPEDRRLSQQFPITWHRGGGNVEIEVGVGFFDDGRPAEVFAIARKSEIDAVLADACVIVSHFLQGGGVPAGLARMALRQDVPEHIKIDNPDAAGEPLSPIGAIADLLLDLERARAGAPKPGAFSLRAAKRGTCSTAEVLAALKAAGERLSA